MLITITKIIIIIEIIITLIIKFTNIRKAAATTTACRISIDVIVVAFIVDDSAVVVDKC